MKKPDKDIIEFYYKEFLTTLHEHSPEIAGAWIKILCIIWQRSTDGTLTRTLGQFSGILNTSLDKTKKILQYIHDEDIGDITEKNGEYTILSRRWQRDLVIKELNKLRQAKHREKRNFKPGSEEYRLAKLLFDEIRERKPDFKEKNLQAEAHHIDLMIRVDKRDPQKIANVIAWCQTDDFWQNNILSTSKLRKQFDKLELKMNKINGYTPKAKEYAEGESPLEKSRAAEALKRKQKQQGQTI